MFGLRRFCERGLLPLILVISALIGPMTPAALAYGQPPQALPDDSSLVSGPVRGIVSVPILNIRAGPGTGYAIIDHVQAGAVLNVQSQNAAADWLQVQMPDGSKGWVSAQFVSVGDASANKPASDGSPTRIVAPTIKLDTRVMPTGWHEVRNADGTVSADWDVPSYAAGWLINSAKPGETGNAVLSGHHNILGQVFRYVVNLNVGDPITLYVGDRAFRYQVSDRFILPDKYVSDEQRRQNARWIGQFNDERLTLVTCWPYTNNTHRVIVIARPVWVSNP